MRAALEAKKEERCSFTGRFERYGKRSGWMGLEEMTVLLVDIRDGDGLFVCDHIWFSLTRGFGALSLAKCDRVSFEARVRAYIKGYRGHRVGEKPLEIDYGLSRPTKVYKL